MRRLWLAIRLFFLVLFHSAAARQIAGLLAAPQVAGPPAAEKPKPTPAPAAPPKPVRSEAITLLATLQREARLVDFVQEKLDAYSDAQIGAAARDVHRECGKVLERLFALRPLSAESEGAEVDVPWGFDAGRYRLTGGIGGEPPFCGRLVHPGWEATRCDLPVWSGSASAARVVSPVEVEVA